MKTITFCLILVTSFLIAAAQPKTGVYYDDGKGGKVALGIQRMDMSVDVVGHIATTTVDMVVKNTTDRVLDGEYIFSMQDGHTVSRFALDINGRLREGVVVDKAKGREAYESTIRQKIDPALLEWTRGNAFRTRVYPLPAHGTRHLVISYEQELLRGSTGLSYQSPFAFAEKIDSFSFHVDVHATDTKPALTGGVGTAVSFTLHERSYMAEFSGTDIALAAPFLLQIPITSGKPSVAVNDFKDVSYFAAFLHPRVTTRQRSKPFTIALVWDVSASAAGRDVNKEIDFLHAMWRRIGTASVDLTTFDITRRSVRRFSIADGKCPELDKVLQQQQYDGGTQLSALDLASLKNDVVILCSDGISTFGSHTIGKANAPVIAVTSAPQADHDVLRGLAVSTGGAIIDLTKMSIGDAETAFWTDPQEPQTIRIIDGAADIRTMPSGLVGILHSDHATIIADLDTIHLSKQEDMVAGSSIARLWARSELALLGMDRERNKTAITALGTRFSLVTPGTSLIVLDRVQDYVRYGIEPPSSEPELVEQYRSIRSRPVNDSAQRYAAHFERVVAMFKERAVWWGRVFTSPSNVRVDSNTRLINGSKRHSMAIDVIEANAGRTRSDTTVILADRDFPRKERPVASVLIQDNATVSTGQGELANPLDPERSRLARTEGKDLQFVVRASRSSNEQVLVDGLTITEPFTGGLAKVEVTEDNVTGEISIAKPAKDAAYVSVVRSSSDPYAAYLALREEYGQSPAFYLDVADILAEKKKTDLALRVLSNIAEMRSEDHRLLRILGYRLMKGGYNDLAVMIFEDVLAMREEEPQSYRDLGLAYAQAKRYQDAVSSLYSLATRPWDGRFPEVELIALNEMNRVIAEQAKGVSVSKIDPRLLAAMPVDVRIVVSWDADDCDIDLWVTDPRNEKCMYSNRDTKIGGHLSHDLTGGYGPEEFLLKNALPGDYKVQVNYFGDRQQRLSGPTTVYVDMYTNYGKPNEKKQSVILKLDKTKEVIDVGALTFK
ncbi:MAG: DUF2135 domain-containing protein [Bacteroidetes bacterium]|nr:DUF2135 domain-containing protein [Bacteroidota bacterium]